jgi:hypothetical protein
MEGDEARKGKEGHGKDESSSGSSLSSSGMTPVGVARNGGGEPIAVMLYSPVEVGVGSEGY